jgi:O-antigen/teichoic acid export membrane protein
LTPSFAQLTREGGDSRERYLKSVAYLTGVAWPFYAVTAVVAYPAIVVLFGPAWGDAAVVAQVLCLGHALYATWATATQLMMGLGKVDTILRGELIQQPLRVALVLVTAQWGLAALAWGQVFVFAVAGIVYLRWVCPIIGASFMELAQAMKPSAQVTAATIIPVVIVFYLSGERVDSNLARLVASAFAAGVSWLTAIVVTGHPLRHEIMRVLPRSWQMSAPSVQRGR